MKVAGSALVLWLLAVAPLGAAAQSGSRDLAEAADLERAGRPAEAAVRYRSVLRGDPASVAALLGLERVLTSSNQLDSLVPLVRRALVADSLNGSVRSLALRMWAALGRGDSVSATARRWIALDPGSADPYREWAFTLSQRGDFAGARRALAEGSARQGGNVLAPDLAQLTALIGEWPEAARQWVLVVRANPAMLANAAGSLGRAPVPARDELLSVLLGARSDSTSRLIAADVMVGWARADEAWPLLDAALPRDPRVAAGLLQRFADRAGATRSRPGALARAYALERLASLVDAAAATHVRLLASQAYAEAGDLPSAQRLLERAGAGGMRAGELGSAAAPAMASLIRAMAQQGSVEEAEQQFKTWRERLSGDDRESLREAIAWAWVGRGRLDRAEASLEADSGVAATAVRGWIALYQGDLADARQLFRAAGPYTGSREEATQRMATLVLLEHVAVEKLPDLGRALQDLLRGDTGQAMEGLDRTARQLPPGSGRADVLELAGELAYAHRDDQTAAERLAGALAADSLGPAAPAAELALARVHARAGRTQVAMRQLEHLILAHPQSALVPQARRLMDQLRGVIP